MHCVLDYVKLILSSWDLHLNNEKGRRTRGRLSFIFEFASSFVVYRTLHLIQHKKIRTEIRQTKGFVKFTCTEEDSQAKCRQNLEWDAKGETDFHST